MGSGKVLQTVGPAMKNTKLVLVCGVRGTQLSMRRVVMATKVCAIMGDVECRIITVSAMYVDMLHFTPTTDCHRLVCVCVHYVVIRHT